MGEVANCFRIEGWHVDPQANLLARNGREVRIEPRVMRVLVCLATRRGRPVGRDELMEFAWNGVFVGEDALNAAISKLRRLFGDDPRNPQFIATVPKVGYRLIAPVEEAAADRRPARTVSPSVAAALLLVAAIFAAVVWLLMPDVREMPQPQRMTPITTAPGIEVQPAISPGTGERVAYAWKGPEGGSWDIWIRGVAGGEPVQVTRGAGVDQHPVWSPDASWLAFVRNDSGCSVMRVRALGGDPERLTSCGSDVGDLDWSPDGAHLVWTERSAAGAPHRVVLLGLESGRKRAVTDPDVRMLGDVGVAFAPDGKRIAFIRSPALGTEEIWVGALEGGAARQVTHLGGKIHGFDWADDETLVVSSNRGGLFALWSVPVSGGTISWITGGTSDIDAPSVGGDGTAIAFEQWNDEANLYRVDIESGERARFISSSRWDWDAAFSPDGSRVAFISDRSGSPELWLAAADGRAAVQRTSFRGPYVARPRWSPDGASIAFESRSGGVADIWILAAAGGAARRITSDVAQDLAPFWSPDGKRIFFGSNRSGEWAIWSQPRDGGDARLEVPGAWTGSFSGPGDLLYMRRGLPALWRLAAGGGEPSEVIADLMPLDALNWAVRGDRVLYVRRATPDEPLLVEHDLIAGTSREIAPLGRLLRHSGVAVSPDGSSVVVALIDRLEADIVMLTRSTR